MPKPMKSNRQNRNSSGHRRKGARRVEEQKTALLNHLRDGHTIREACRLVDLTPPSYYYYRREDPAFKQESDKIRDPENHLEPVQGNTPVPDFPEFCEQWLGRRLFHHQLQWFDILEGREPRDLHPAQTYTPGDPTMVVVNTPVGHAKTTTFGMYITWKLVQDPSFRVVIVSKAQSFAMRILGQIKGYLTSPKYRRMQEAFGPLGGWSADSQGWTQKEIFLSASVRVDGEKDPNVQALGIRGQIYGARSDLILLDDVVTNVNAGEWPKQLEWIQTEVLTRGSNVPVQVIVIGTRIAPQDLYVELMNGDNYFEESSPWTYMAQPAVLEFADDPKDWVTLWPRTDEAPKGSAVKPDEDGLYPMKDGLALVKDRAKLSPSRWARVYQQEQVTEDTVFKPEDIKACAKGWSMGEIPDVSGAGIGRPGGMSGLKIIAGMDPSATNFTAVVVVGFDPETGQRFVIHVHNEASMTPDAIRQLIRDLTTKYNISEWRIEDNAFQKFLTLDSEIRGWLSNRGSILVPHTTGRNKNDPDFGVMAMEGLFREPRKIVLPRLDGEAMLALFHQLSVWVPDPPRTQKTDVVMALWFAELRCLELVRNEERRKSFNDYNREFFTRADMAERRSVNPLQPPDDNPYAVPQEWKVMA